MRTIYKYKLELKETQRVSMPAYSQIIKAGVQDNEIYIWAIIDTDKELLDKLIRIVGTGNSTDAMTQANYHIDTVFMGSFVWHIFDLGGI